MQTDGPQTRINTRSMVLNVQEANRERREKIGKRRARNGNFGRGVLRRPSPKTGPTQGERAKKIPTDKSWDFNIWWWNTEPNPRPHPDKDSNVLALRAWFR
jgi:hypothetical protein